MSAMHPAAVVVSYRTSDRLDQCLAAVEGDQPGVAVYVADNESDAVRLGELGKRHPTAVMLPDAQNPGFAAGVNRGVARAFADGASHVLVLNDDVFVRAGSFRRLKEAAGACRVAAPYLDGNGDGVFRGGRIDWTTGIAGHADGAEDYLCAACLMISRPAWDLVGPFDEAYFLYYEDVDWCVRAVAAGVDLVLVPEVLGWHEGGASTGGGGDPVVIYWWTRNRLRFIRKHRGYRAGLAVAVRSIRRGTRRSAMRVVNTTRGSGPEAPDGDHGSKRQLARVRGLAAGLTTRIRTD